MDLNNYNNLVSSESNAYKYLSKKGLKNGHRICPRCNNRKFYKLATGKRRCSKCRYTFHDFSERWINHGRLSYIQWLSLLKLFELEQSVRKIAEQASLAYNTAYTAIETIRYSILAHAVDALDLLGSEIELDESYFGGRRSEWKGERP